jgi:hypothetical protein
MKGSISIWIWIVGGVIVGLIILTIVSMHFKQISEAMIEKRSLEQYEELRNQIDELCWSFSENKREYSLSLSKTIKGIYLTEDKYLDINDSEFVDYIINENISSGDFLCIKVEGKRTNCNKLDCTTYMPYIGSVPTEYSLSALIDEIMGNPKEFKYGLKLKKEGEIIKITKIEDDKGYNITIPCDFDLVCEINKTPNETNECKQDCKDCYGPCHICLGDKFCNPYIKENCNNSLSDCNCSL